MAVTNYVWDVENDSYLMETDGSDNTTVAYTSEPVQYGRVIFQHRDGETNYYHFDVQGSTRQITNAATVVTDTQLYDSFGLSLSTSGTTVNNLRYIAEPGYYHDPQNSNYYTRARSFEPTIARWTSFPFAVVPRFANYVYVLNRPIIYDAPSGLYNFRAKDINSMTGRSVRRTFYKSIGGRNLQRAQFGLSATAPARNWVIVILPAGGRLAPLSCGDTAERRWKFKIPGGAPCDGYFVQKVSVRVEGTRDCDKEDEIETYEYWETFGPVIVHGV